MKTINLISLSGGKDSQAVLNYCLKHYKKETIIAYFCDTGWEAPETYKHLEYLEETLNIKIERVKSSKYKNFEDMCIKKGFPSRIKRFCTTELKIIPSSQFVKSFLDKGYKVRNFVGVRKDESKNKILEKAVIKNGVKWIVVPKRSCENRYKTTFLGLLPNVKIKQDGSISKTKKIIDFYSKENAVTTIQPIITWSEKDVYLYNLNCGTKNNPLYAKGSKRVGCYPCIMSNDTEIGLLSKDRVDRVVALEKAVRKANGKSNCVFMYQQKGKLQDFATIFKQKEFNPLGLDLECINHLGICE